MREYRGNRIIDVRRIRSHLLFVAGTTTTLDTPPTAAVKRPIIYVPLHSDIGRGGGGINSWFPTIKKQTLICCHKERYDRFPRSDRLHTPPPSHQPDQSANSESLL